MDIEQQLAHNITSESKAYGYTLSIWGGGSVLGHVYGTPIIVQTFLYVVGSTIPDLTVEYAPVAATGKRTSRSLLGAQTDDDDLTATLARDPTVSAIEELWRTDTRHFYRVEWSYDSHCRMNILLQSQGLLLSSQGTDSQWWLDLLYPDRETLRHAKECWERFGLSLTIEATFSRP